METCISQIYNYKNKQCSYPTYEEWKHYIIRIILYTTFGSYPTYEEWKLDTSIPKSLNFRSSFLSYLWGMETGFSFD